MAKKTLLTIGGTYRKVKAGYITVGGVYHKIKSAYITVGGVYRPFWATGSLSYFGLVTDLSLARRSLAATPVGSYALFGGGRNASSRVDVYDAQQTRSTAENLSAAKFELAATTVGDLAIFAGGRASTSEGSSNAGVDFYDSALTHSQPATRLVTARRRLAAATAGNTLALFVGGSNSGSDGSGAVNDVQAYDANGTAITNLTFITNVRESLAGVAIGNYAAFAGGLGVVYLSDVWLYDSKGTVYSTAPKLSASRASLAAATAGRYVIFAGGYSSARGTITTADAYDSSMTQLLAAPSLIAQRHTLAATTLGESAIFAGGNDPDHDTSHYRPEVDVYNESLTHSTPTALSVGRYEHAAATIGNVALFAGGNTSSGVTATVEAYTI